MGGALGVVLVPDLFRAALLLILVFISVAGFFILLSAEFLAVVQVLIYVGAIAILIIFAVMLTRDVQRGNLPNRMHIPAAVFAALLLSAMVAVAVQGRKAPRLAGSGPRGLAVAPERKSGYADRPAGAFRLACPGAPSGLLFRRRQRGRARSHPG